MDKVVLELDYQCFPMWIYSEGGELIDNDLIPELQGNRKIERLLTAIQDQFNSLFLDTETEFSYVGFSNIKDREDFKNQVNLLIELIQPVIETQYQFENLIDVDKM